MLGSLEEHFRQDEDEVVKLRKVMMDYAQALVAAVSSDRRAIDQLISKISRHWKLHRISRVDRNILRMAIAEFTRFPDIPGRVILNEAIEIGKKYGAENSGAFINGILDRIHVLQDRPSSPEQMLLLLTTLDD